MSYKTYQEYKNSNNIWAGNIPSHWELHKIKNLIFFQEGPGLRNWQFTDDGIRVICVTNITSNGIDFSNYEKFISEGEYKQTYSHFTVNKGDLLLSSSGNSWGKVAEYTDDETVILNTSTIRINKNPTSDYELKQPYIKWALQSEYIREQLGLMMTGSCQPNFGPTHLAKVSILMPPIEEQKQIANYLDKQTAKIDVTIAKNEKLIQLLEEKRVALINDTLINIDYPIVKLKDVLKVGGYIRGPFGSSLKRDELKYEGIPIYEQQHAIYDSREFRYYIDEEKYNELIRFKIKPNDLIISCSGTIGRISIIKEDDPIGIISQALLILRINNNVVLPQYLKYFLTSDRGHEFLVSESNGAAQVNISQKDVINKIPIKLPPLSIQNEIISELNNINAHLNKTITKIQENIALLEEYKTSLIHHVVTGKINVNDEG